MRNQQQNIQWWKNICAGMLGTLAVLVVAGLFGLGLTDPVQPRNVHSQVSLSDFESTITGVVDQVQDSVVTVNNYQRDQQMGNIFWGNDGLEINDIQKEPVLAGTGSGVVYKVDGDTAYVVTNNHVIAGADQVEVELRDGTVHEAEVVGSDQISDLAVLKISAKGVGNPIEFANSDEVKVGQTAIAIGSPLSSRFASSVTQGIVSGLNRSIPVDINGDGQPDWEMTLMQTDAAINPGNSGGALVNSQGQLMGINSSKYASSQIDGMGFAIPSNEVKHIISMLEEYGEVIRPVLGVGTYNLNRFSRRSLEEELNLPETVTEGALIANVQSQSAADKAGLEALDIITALNGEPVTDSQSLKRILYQYQVGDTVTLTIYREGEEMQLEVTLTNKLNHQESSPMYPIEDDGGEQPNSEDEIIG